MADGAGLVERTKGALARADERLGGHGRLVAALLVLAAGVALLLRRAPDLGEVAAAFADVRFGLVAAAFLANAASVTLHALVWRLTLGQALSYGCPPTTRVVTAHWIGVLGNILFPARAGEAARVGVLARHVERDHALPALAGSAVAHRVIEALPAVLLVFVVLVLAPLAGWAQTAFLVGAAGVVAALVVAFLFGRRSEQDEARGPGEAGREDDGLVMRLRLGLSVLRTPVPVAAAAGVATLAITSQLLALWLVLVAFGLDVPLVAAAVVLLLTEAVLLISLWPGNFGVYQAVIAAGLLAFGVPYTTGLAYGIAIQALDVAVAAALGAAALVAEGDGLAQLRGGEGD